MWRGGFRGKTAPDSRDRPPQRQSRWGPGRPERTGLEGPASSDRGEYASGPRSQSAASAFLPSRGADPVETCCGGRGAVLRVRELVVRPPCSPLPLSPDITLELRGGGSDSQVTHLICFICSPEGQRFENGMLSLGLFYTCTHTPI